jgi:hypothetical protein
MSYKIEFDRIVFTFDGYNEYGDSRKNRLLLLHKRGASNVIDNKDNIARNWKLVTIGSEKETISHLASFANEVEAGYLRYQNGTTKIENYIKNWRNENRVPIGEITEYFQNPEVVIYHPKGESYKEKITSYQKEIFERMINNWRRTNNTVGGDNILQYHHDITEDTVQMVDALNEVTGIEMNLTEK